MTVCLAAICDNYRIVGACDRMLTGGNVEFEPNQTKFWRMSSSVVVMIAGDVAIQTEILRAVEAVVSNRIREEPERWWSVKEVAELYRRHCQEAITVRAENAILAPLSLNRESYLARQHELEPELVLRLARQLQKFELEDPLEAIIAGVDMDGPRRKRDEPLGSFAHLYTACNTEITCQDSSGFAAIGTGTSHAEYEFMRIGHKRTFPYADTLLLTYRAKKRAEVAPGVGRETSLFSIGPMLGSYFSIDRSTQEELEKNYQAIQDQVQQAVEASNVRIRKYDEDYAPKAYGVPQNEFRG